MRRRLIQLITWHVRLVVGLALVVVLFLKYGPRVLENVAQGTIFLIENVPND